MEGTVTVTIDGEDLNIVSTLPFDLESAHLGSNLPAA